MKKVSITILVLGLISFMLSACMATVARQTVTYPNPPNTLYSNMIVTLQDLGFTITHVDKASLIILAETKSSGMGKLMDALAGPSKPYQVSAYFTEEDGGGTSLSLTVTQPDNPMGGQIKKWTKKIMENFNERVRIKEK